MEMPEGLKKIEGITPYLNPPFDRVASLMKEMAEALEEHATETKVGYVMDPIKTALSPWVPNKAMIVLKKFKEWK